MLFRPPNIGCCHLLYTYCFAHSVLYVYLFNSAAHFILALSYIIIL